MQIFLNNYQKSIKAHLDIIEREHRLLLKIPHGY